MKKAIEKPVIEIYKPKTGLPTVEVAITEETVWLTQRLMADLFQTTSQNITFHLNNIFKDGELTKKSTCKDFLQVQIEGGRRVKRRMKFYNLDAIISVGYRIRTKTATQFRIWATNTLQGHLVKGYTLNEKRLKQQAHKYQELKNSVKLLENLLALDEITHDQARGMIEVVTDYAYALDILDQYDYKTLEINKITKKEYFKIDLETAIQIIKKLKTQFGSSDIFGLSKDKSFQSSIAAIYQSAGGIDVYPSVEEKAAHLLYFVTKNHSFVDGNKRIAAALFIYFLNQNKILYRNDGSKRLPDTTLVALTVLIAQSKPDEKDTIIRIIVNLINKNIL